MDDRRRDIAALYADHIQESTRLAFLLTGSRELAEDLAQDAFISAAGRFQHLRDKDAFHAYLTKAVVNRCRAHWRRSKVEGRFLDGLRREPKLTAHQPPVAERLAIVDALDALSPRQRTAVVLRHYADLSERQAADLMGCSMGTVKTLTSRGLQALREQVRL